MIYPVDGAIHLLNNRGLGVSQNKLYGCDCGSMRTTNRLFMVTLIAYLYTQIRGSTLGAVIITESKKQYAETKECNTATLDQVYAS